MPKRSRLKVTSLESNALKRMRLLRSLSLRNAAKVIGVSPTLINHTENGRAPITEQYLLKFLTGLNFSRKDWDFFLSGDQKSEDYREKCMAILRYAQPSKLEVMYRVISNL